MNWIDPHCFFYFIFSGQKDHFSKDICHLFTSQENMAPHHCLFMSFLCMWCFVLDLLDVLVIFLFPCYISPPLVRFWKGKIKFIREIKDDLCVEQNESISSEKINYCTYFIWPERSQNEENSKSRLLDCGHKDRDHFYACPLDLQYKEKEVFIHI